MVKRTNVTLQESIKEYAGYSDEDFQSLTIKELRHVLSTELGVTNIQRDDGSIIPTNSGRKGEIIKAIKEVVHPVKVVESIAPEMSVEQIEAVLQRIALMKFDNIREYADKVYSMLLDYVQGLWNSERQEWQNETQRPHDIAREVVLYLEYSVNGEGKRLADSTKVKYASEIYNRIESLFDRETSLSPDFKKKLGRAIEAFRSTQFKQIEPINLRVKEDRVKRDATRLESAVTIDPSEALQWAYDILTDPFTQRWQDVSIAIALVTGRRQAEIHSTGKFSSALGQEKPPILNAVPDTHLLQFYGQLKAHKRSTSFLIPTLIPARMVLDGFKALDEAKRIYGASENRDGLLMPSSAVNKVVASNLSKGHIDNFYDIYFPLIQNHEHEGKEIKVRTYHRIRDIYGKCAIASFESGRGFARDEKNFLKTVLGHATDTASDSYDLDLVIVSGAQTWIKGE